VEKAGQLRERLEALTGAAETPDGLLRAHVTAAAGLVELFIDPRAMRLPSMDLAEAICRLAQDAQRHLEAQTQQAAAETYGDDLDAAGSLATPEGRQEKLDALRGAFTSATGDATALLDLVRKGLGR